MGPVGQAGLRPLLHTLNYKGWLLFFLVCFTRVSYGVVDQYVLWPVGSHFSDKRCSPVTVVLTRGSSCFWSGFAESKLISILRIF